MPLLLLIIAGLAFKIGVPFILGLAAGAFLSFRLGQYHRGFTHARGIWHSHKSAIRGGHR